MPHGTPRRHGRHSTTRARSRCPRSAPPGQARLAHASRRSWSAPAASAVPVLHGPRRRGRRRASRIVDHDRVEATNLHRQPLYALGRRRPPEGRGRGRASRGLQPDVRVRGARAAARRRQRRRARADARPGRRLHRQLRHQVPGQRRRACARSVPAVLASVYQYEGQLQVVRARPRRLPACAASGRRRRATAWSATARRPACSGPVPGDARRLQAMEVLKLLLGLDAGEAPALVSSTCSRSRCAGSPRRATRPVTTIVPGLRRRPADAPLELEFATLAAASEAGPDSSTSARPRSAPTTRPACRPRPTCRSANSCTASRSPADGATCWSARTACAAVAAPSTCASAARPGCIHSGAVSPRCAPDRPGAATSRDRTAGLRPRGHRETT